MTGKLKVVDYSEPTSKTSCRGYEVEFNSYWVSVRRMDDKGLRPEEVVYQRQPQMDEWLDESHQRITEAWAELEAALLAVVR